MFQTVLALDFGTKRIGVARSFGSLAEPLEIWPNDDQVWDRLAAQVVADDITKIIVGISEGDMAELSKAFAAQVEARTGLPVTLVDETLSSVQVASKLRQAKKLKPGQRLDVDHYAAAEFLQEWLDSQPMVY